MLNLKEYADSPTLLADYLPWAAIVAPGVVLNKDGSFQTTFRYRGPDLESSTQEELVSVMARVNNVLRRFGSGWALFFEAQRHDGLDELAVVPVRVLALVGRARYPAAIHRFAKLGVICMPHDGVVGRVVECE